MRKALLVTLDFPPAVGGVATYWKNLSEAMPGNQWAVLAPCLSNQETRRTERGYVVYRRRLLSSWLLPRWLPLMIHIWRVVKKEKPSVIVVGQILPVGTAVWLLSFIMRIPYVVSTHGMDVVLPMLSWRKFALCKVIFGKARKIITVSEYTAGKIVEYGILRSKISLLPGCPSIDPLSVDAIKPFEKSGPVLLTVGRLVKRKGHEDVIRALPEIIRHTPDVRYVIVGDGPCRWELEELARQLDVNYYVEFLGEVLEEEKARWLKTCDVFVMTPRTIGGDVEGFGLVYLEANLFSKPVIATRSGGVPDAVVDGVTGVLLEEGDVDGISANVVRLLQNADEAELLGRQGRERVLRYFAWKRQGETLKTILDI